MNDFVGIKSKDGRVLYVQTQELEGCAEASEEIGRDPKLPPGEDVGVKEDIAAGIDLLRDNISLAADTVLESLAASQPDQWSVELNIAFSGKAKIPVLVEGEAKAAIKVIASWKRSTD